MVQVLVLNRSHVVPGSGNSRFRYQFQGGGITLKERDKLALSSLQIPYSVYNISSLYGNNSFSYVLNGTSYPVLLRDGFYTIDDISGVLQATMFANGHYRLLSTGDRRVFAELQYNPTYYGIQLNVYPITATVVAGDTNPAPFNVGADTSIQLSIPDSPIKKIFGFNAGLHPALPSTTIFSKVSDFTPTGSELNTVVMRCNLVSNSHASPPDILSAFSWSVPFGSNQLSTASEYAWCNTRRGTFSSLEVQLCDENYGNIVLQDAQVCILLLLKIAAEE